MRMNFMGKKGNRRKQLSCFLCFSSWELLLYPLSTSYN